MLSNACQYQDRHSALAGLYDSARSGVDIFKSMMLRDFPAPDHFWLIGAMAHRHPDGRYLI
ncbi:MAG: hypothetical protein WB775_11780, partial [Burkholderiaceae bacterium]